MTKRMAAIVKTIIMMLIIGFFVLSAILFSVNYRDVYGFPSNENAVLDFGSSPMSEFDYNVITTGEWEFFYNKWIVTDSIECEPDFLIQVPARWTGKQINGEKLKNTGYASYRFTVLNAEIGADLLVELYNFPVAFKVFVNNELNCRSGTVSKSASGSVASGLFDEIIPYTVTNNEPIEIVLELSYNAYGGLFIAPWINDYGRPTNIAMNLISVMTYLVTGMMAAFVVFSLIVNLGLYHKEKQLTFVLLIFSIFCHLLTTRDVFWQFGKFFSVINFTVVYELCFITGVLSMVAFLVFILRQKIINITRPRLCIICALLLICTAVYYVLYGTAYQIIPVAAGILCFCYLFYLMLRSYKRKISLYPLMILFVLLSTYILEALEDLGVIVYALAPVISFMLLIIMIFISLYSFIKIRDNANSALKAATLENEVRRIKHQALKSQIKPHFIFNVLSSIQKLYRKDTAAGGDALAKFSAHLRQNIDSDNNDVIAFDKEIKNIMNYVELENLRLDKKLMLLFDIEYSDFEIPILSLQPLVENAIKYAGTEDKNDGYIRIKSKREGNEIIVAVIDNGRGFDAAKVREDGVGLKNSRQRFKYLLNAEMSVASKKDEGTTVTIIIPVKRGE